MYQFAERLRIFRKTLGITKTQLSKYTGITACSLTYYENYNVDPSLSVVYQLASKCKVSIDWLVGIEPLENLKIPQVDFEQVESKRNGTIKVISDIKEGDHYVYEEL